MKKALLVSLFTVPCMLAAQNVLYTDDFESYTAGSMIAASNGTNWSTWSVAPGGTEDAPISSAYAQSGSNSVGIISTNAADGGPADLLLKLGNKTTGVYNLTFSLYIPTGKGGYFNLQHYEDVSVAQYAIEVMLPANGDVMAATGATAQNIGSYPHDVWFNVSLDIDLDNLSSTLTMAGNTPFAWASNTSSNVATLNNQIGCMDFFAYGGGIDLGEMYIDDVTYTDNTTVGLAEAASIVAGAYPNPTRDAVTITLASPLSATAIVQLRDVTGSLVTVPIKVDGNQIATNLHSVPAGVYFLRVKDGAVQTAHRLVKN